MLLKSAVIWGSIKLAGGIDKRLRRQEAGDSWLDFLFGGVSLRGPPALTLSIGA
jgi:hypothetical protein